MIKSLPAPNADRDYISDIPEEAEEKVVSFYTEDENAREEGGTIHYERREYLIDGELVGYRQFDHDGRLIIETPMQGQKKHGTEYTWFGTNLINSASPNLMNTEWFTALPNNGTSSAT